MDLEQDFGGNGKSVANKRQKCWGVSPDRPADKKTPPTLPWVAGGGPLQIQPLRRRSSLGVPAQEPASLEKPKATSGVPAQVPLFVLAAERYPSLDLRESKQP